MIINGKDYGKLLKQAKQRIHDKVDEVITVPAGTEIIYRDYDIWLHVRLIGQLIPGWYDLLKDTNKLHDIAYHVGAHNV